MFTKLEFQIYFEKQYQCTDSDFIIHQCFRARTLALFHNDSDGITHLSNLLAL